MQKKAVLWANQFDFEGNTKKVLQILAKNSDEYGRVPVSVDSLVNESNIPEKQVISEIKFLAVNKILVSLEGDVDFYVPEKLLDKTNLCHCKLSINVPHAYFFWQIDGDR